MDKCVKCIHNQKSSLPEDPECNYEEKGYADGVKDEREKYEEERTELIDRASGAYIEGGEAERERIIGIFEGVVGEWANKILSLEDSIERLSGQTKYIYRGRAKEARELRGKLEAAIKQVKKSS